MKKFLHIICLMGFFSICHAQQYGNEWIDYSKTYYKFKLGKTSLYRITYSSLINLGIPNNQLRGTNFKLIRNGKEVPLYVTTNGPFGATDFIEFYGEKNDGKPDSLLYKNPEDQPHNKISLFTDSAACFFTIDPFSINARVTQQTNDLSSIPIPEKFCYYAIYFTGTGLYRGLPISSNFSQLYNSDFDKGEGHSLGVIAPGTQTFVGFNTHFVYKEPSVNAYYYANYVLPEGSQNIRVTYNAFDTTDINFGPMVKKSVYTVNSMNLSEGGWARFYFDAPRIIPRLNPFLAGVELQYPRLFNFNGQSTINFSFRKTDDLYFEIKNFDAQSTAPILYDLNNNQRYEGITDTALKFHLFATALEKDKLYLSSQSSTDIPTISSFTPTNFTNFLSASPGSGDYIIISNKKLKASLSGTDFVEEYRKYRSSTAGGNFTARTYFIDELYDQFGFGIIENPLAIRNFVNFALDNFTIKPKMVFVIGKGLDYSKMYRNQGLINKSLVPTFGEPASDNLLTARSSSLNYPQIGIGRLSVKNGDEIKAYLDKVKDYEAILNDTINASLTPYNKSWMKNILHLGGGNNNFEQQIIRNYLDNYKTTIEAPKYGGSVSSLFKNTTDPIQIAQNIFLDSLINSGVSLITFFGHSATTTTDFNLEPERMSNYRKYHLMLSNGCFIGSVFEDASNLLSERFVLLPNKAAIGYIAPVTYAVISNLNSYSSSFYNYFSNTLYNDAIGTILQRTSKDVILSGIDINPSIGHQMIFHGDPGLRINTHFKPDFYIDESSVSFEPQNINAAADSFLIKLIVRNLGAAVPDNYIINVDRIFPNGQIQATSVNVPSARNIDTVQIWIKSDRINGPGLNSFKIKVDYANAIAEYSELNNEINVTKLILADDIIPIFPYEFCIVNDANHELVFSTANPFATPKSYIFQIDTTENFNSPLLTQLKTTAPGATIKWNPTIPLIENKVYYWRGTLDTTVGNPANWKKSSFLYNTSLSTGWNQSHYFQYLRNSYSTLNLKTDRDFHYPNTVRTLQIRNGIIYDQLIEAFWDGYLIARNAWARKGFIFFVYDANTGQNWQTFQIGNTCRGPWNDITCNRYPINVIEFITNDFANGKTYRQDVANFINSIPCNAYVMGYSFYNAGYSQWLVDSLNVGDANLYQAFENLGVTKIRQQQENAPFVFFLQKCNNSLAPIQIQRFIPDIIDTTFTFSGSWNKGSMETPIIGPASSWTDFHMDWHSKETPTSFDEGTVNLYGYGINGTRTLLRTDLLKNNVTPVSIDAQQFPFLQMQWLTKDDSMSTPPQMDFWRLYYAKAPEAVVNPSIYFSKTRDSIISGENFNMSVAVENVTPINMDSLLVKFIIKDASGNITSFYQRFAPLPGKSHINIDFNYTFSGFNFFGLNYVTVEVNPDDDQIEQFHFNNFAEFTVFIERDKINPLLDITFDGRHIIDGEYVSANPEILFRLKDENKYLALNDTSGFLIYLYYPNNPEPVQVSANRPDVTFMPATNLNLGKNNEARLIFKPTLADGTYEIRAQGIDRSKNDAGKYDYRIQFKVDSKPSITNVLNYPNPFSSTTQFVFTLTGASIPDQLIIQIFSASGKVVKEITRADLGNLHIGVNVTDYKWDGTDNFGDRLANGVYFYRVMTKNIDGTSTEIKESSIDKYFKKGYGKLYIFR